MKSAAGSNLFLSKTRRERSEVITSSSRASRWTPGVVTIASLQ